MNVAMKRFDTDGHAARIREIGYTVIEDFLDQGSLTEVRRSLSAHLESHRGRNDFEGFKTERVYTLVARGEVFQRTAEDRRLLAVLDRFLRPGYLLTASQAISIYPGETAQAIHNDDGFYRQPRPRPAISFTLIAAVDEFTAANGGTEIVPGSHLWSDDQVAAALADPKCLEAMLQPMEIPAGACVIFSGTLLHRGGANRTMRPRLAFSHQYCEPWARTQENFFLAIPREMARAMSPRLQQLLGYEIWPPFMGMVTASHPKKALEPDFVPPIVAQRPKPD